MLNESRYWFRAGLVSMLAVAGSAHAQLGGLARSDIGADGNEGAVVEDHPNRTDVKLLKFYSSLLRRETITKVYLPPNYSSDEPVPVLYFLHGTSASPQSWAWGFIDEVEGLPPQSVLGPGRSSLDGWGGAPVSSWFDDPAQRVPFVVVGPDLGGGEKWCADCWWVDGRNGEGVAAESHLYQELIPVIERTFNVRKGRNGRALAGKSMGANGSLIQGFRHPDRWRFVLALSPTLPGESAVFQPYDRHFQWLLYLAQQGYGHPVVDEIHYENIDPVSLTENVLGSDLGILVHIGNGCVPPENTDPACSPGPDQKNEFGYRFYMDMWAAYMAEQGVDLTYIGRQGNHGTGQGDSWKRFFAQRVQQMFSTPAPVPELFSYSSVDSDFAAWGWDFAVARPTNEFLHVTGARTDGTGLTLAGTGQVTVTTPPLKGPFKHARVQAIRDGVEAASFPAVEVVEGNRLRFTVNLDARALVTDQREELVRSGKYSFPRTRVRLLPPG